MNDKITVIVNADDFALNERCSEAIAEAFRLGLVSDTTMVANGDYLLGAKALAEKYGFADKIGIHFNITEGNPLTKGISGLSDFVTNGRFNKSYDILRKLSPEEETAIYDELRAQVEALLSVGISLTHADSHHYIHNAPYIAPIAARVCEEYGIRKIRLSRTDSDFKAWARSRGFITTEHFIRLRDIDGNLPNNTEILVHPDFDKNGALIDRYGVKDGYPFGAEIPDLKKLRGFVFSDYRTLF